jgi:Ni/Co efflux regulator RcnB
MKKQLVMIALCGTLLVSSQFALAQAYRPGPPPRGYQYIRSDNGDFLLAAVATGAILSIIAANH